jgi:hypothetical protein
MDSKQRLIILIISGILLLAVASYVFWHYSSKKEDPSAELTTNTAPTINRIAKANLPTQTPSKNLSQNPTENTTGKTVVQTTTTTAAAATNEPSKTDTSDDKQLRSIIPNKPTTIAAISRDQAGKEAREVAGREDPMMYVSGYLPYPATKPNTGDSSLNKIAKTTKNHKNIWEKPVGKIPKLIPPPPTDMAKLVPPPPPTSEFPKQGFGSIANLPISTLPSPPSRPTIADKMKLVSILDDKAILAFSNPNLQIKNKWPKTLTLGPGDQFESVSVISVDRDSITLQEDGERSVKVLERVR